MNIATTTEKLWQEALAEARRLNWHPDDRRAVCRAMLMARAKAMREAAQQAKGFWHWGGLSPWAEQRAAEYERAAEAAR